MKLIPLVILAVIFVGCNPLRHYQKVQEDNYRNEAERNLLAKACNEEFPRTVDTVRLTQKVLDTTAYEEYRRNYQELLDRIIEEQDKHDTIKLPGEVRVNPCKGADSVRVIRNFLKTYNPPAKIEYKTYEVVVPDKPKETLLQRGIDQCREENAKLTKENESLQRKARQGTVFKWVLIGVGVLLILLVIGWFMGKIKLPVRT